MNRPNSAIERIVTRLAFTIAAIIASAVPIGYWLVSYHNLSETLEFKAQVKAHALEELIAANPASWKTAQGAIADLINRIPVALIEERVSLFDTGGNTVAFGGPFQNPPLLVRTAPIHGAGQFVGHVAIERRYSDLVGQTFVAGLVGIALGGMVLIALRTVPVAALRRLSRQLQQEQERASATFHSMADALINTDTEQRILYANPVAEAMLGLPLSRITGKKLTDIVRLGGDDTGDPVE